MASFKFILRPSLKTGRHPGSLSLRVIHERRPKTVCLSRFLLPEEWDAASQTIVYPSDDPSREKYLTDVQVYMETCMEKITGVIQKLENKRGAYTVDDIVVGLRNSVDDGKLLGYAATLAAEMRENNQHRTARAYGTVCRGFVAFNKGVDIPLEQLTATLIKKYETFLKENGKQPNTISYNMRNLRAIYNKAVAAKRIPANEEKPFAGVFTGVEETRKRALTADEVNRLKIIDFDKLLQEHEQGTQQYENAVNLYRAWRLFFFCLYSQGMCFVDLCYLKKTNVKGNVIRYYRKKTGRQIEVPISEIMKTLIESFADEVKDSQYLFPIINDVAGEERMLYEAAMRAQNRRLKRLAKLAGMDKMISTHVARHSWATICKNELLPVSVISEGLGHSSEKMTRKYLASFNLTTMREVGKTVFKAISRSSVRAAALF